MADQKKRILIIEDEKPIAGALELKLGHSGFVVKVAYNGEEALNFIEGESFDLILLDLVMPRMNGFDFLENMRSSGNRIPVIVLSNLSQEEDVKKARDLGVVDYFIKSNTSISKIVEHAEKALESTNKIV